MNFTVSVYVGPKCNKIYIRIIENFTVGKNLTYEMCVNELPFFTIASVKKEMKNYLKMHFLLQIS